MVDDNTGDNKTIIIVVVTIAGVALVIMLINWIRCQMNRPNLEELDGEDEEIIIKTTELGGTKQMLR